jgi:hypothetical protein
MLWLGFGAALRRIELMALCLDDIVKVPERGLRVHWCTAPGPTSMARAKKLPSGPIRRSEVRRTLDVWLAYRFAADGIGYRLLTSEQKGDDGGVEYTGAHIDEAKSESHSVQSRALAMAEVKRILLPYGAESCPVGYCPTGPTVAEANPIRPRGSSIRRAAATRP